MRWPWVSRKRLDRTYEWADRIGYENVRLWNALYQISKREPALIAEIEKTHSIDVDAAILTDDRKGYPMIRQIDMQIVVDSKEEADVLGANLSKCGANTSVGNQRGRWTVFVDFEQNDAAHVGRALLNNQ